jgi:hypothetical protein
MTRKELETIRQLREELAASNERNERLVRQAQLQGVRAELASTTIRAVFNLASAVEWLLDAGLQRSAREMLGMLQQVEAEFNTTRAHWLRHDDVPRTTSARSDASKDGQGGDRSPAAGVRSPEDCPHRWLNGRCVDCLTEER